MLQLLELPIVVHAAGVKHRLGIQLSRRKNLLSFQAVLGFCHPARKVGIGTFTPWLHVWVL